ncbi:MAG: PQQ-binding-like beta-propeller repeat protein, partial [Deltaproteobacteria bacterium]|nr:PQQ-binding-like beta-propeller repeat protein [Kofleriaceae bacterium]
STATIARSLANLAPTWNVEAPDLQPVPFVIGDRVLVADREGMHERDVASGASLAHAAFARPWPHGASVEAADADTAIVSGDRVLVAVDRARGVERWRRELDRSADLVALVGRRVYAVTREGRGASLVVLDAERGDPLATARLPAGVVFGKMWTVRDGLVVAGDRLTGAELSTFVVGLDVDGGVRWRYQTIERRVVDVDRDAERAVIVGAGTATVLRTSDGQVQASWPMRDETVDASLAGDTVYVVAGDNVDLGSEIRAHDLAGRLVWRRRTATRGPLTITADGVLYASQTGEVLVALARTTGAPVWRWGMGPTFDFRVAPDGGVVVGRPVVGGRELVAFQRGRRPAPAHTLSVVGTYANDCSPALLRVGDRWIPPGRFRLSLTGRGLVAIGGEHHAYDAGRVVVNIVEECED